MGGKATDPDSAAPMALGMAVGMALGMGVGTTCALRPGASGGQAYGWQGTGDMARKGHAGLGCP